MPPKTFKTLEPMRQVLRSSLARGLRSLAEEDRLAAAWTVACGSPMATHGEVVGFADGVLIVEVADAAWLAQMISMRSSLEHEISRISGIPLTAIHFERKKTPGGRQPARPSGSPAGRPRR